MAQGHPKRWCEEEVVGDFYHKKEEREGTLITLIKFSSMVELFIG